MTGCVVQNATAARASAGYRTVFGWPVRCAGRAVVLPLTCGIAAVAVPTSWAGEVAGQLRLLDTPVPVLTAPDRPRRWVFLADLQGEVPQRGQAPPGVDFLLGPDCLALPPTVTERGPVRWVSAPDPARRWLPSFAAVLHAIRRHRPVSS